MTWEVLVTCDPPLEQRLRSSRPMKPCQEDLNLLEKQLQTQDSASNSYWMDGFGDFVAEHVCGTRDSCLGC